MVKSGNIVKVNSDFYENGLTMDGKGNRIILKKDERTFTEMTFLGKNMVELRSVLEGKTINHLEVEFAAIREITVHEGMPYIVLL